MMRNDPQARGEGNARFAGALLDPGAAVPGVVRGAAAGTADKRYAVYRNNVVSGLIDGLKAGYPSLLALMGEDVFVMAARHFIAEHPPKSAMMLRFGEGFAAFLHGFAPLRNSPFLADVARLERAWLDAYHAEDVPALEATDLAGVAPDRAMALVFEPHPALALIRSNHAVADLFDFRHGVPEGQVDLNRKQAVMVTRPGLQVVVSTLSPAAFAFHDALAGGAALGEAAEAALAVDEGFDLTGALGTAFASGAYRRPGHARSS
ncbi:MAG: DNA-binding domain-containing protein [Pseudomonadota bacterium]|nr:DNA-binding domain-containing protein [Pseudomonadota bacterium]